MALPDRAIIDLETFNETTGEGRKLAGVYFFYALDCLVELAHRIAHDFFDRPHLYTDLSQGSDQRESSGSIAPLLAKLHARFGAHEEVLATSQREQIYFALFGSRSVMNATSEDGDFAKLRDGLLDACAVFAETKFGDEVSLREIVRQKHRLFSEFVRGQDGDSLKWTRDDALAELTEDLGYTILRNPGVSKVFTGARPPRSEWPYNLDSTADKLVEEISRQLMWPRLTYSAASNGAAGNADGVGGFAREIKPNLTRQDFACFQDLGRSGATGLATVIDIDSNSSDADIDTLVTRCYAWHTALKSLRRQTRHYIQAPEPRASEKRRVPIAAGAAAATIENR